MRTGTPRGDRSYLRYSKRLADTANGNDLTEKEVFSRRPPPDGPKRQSDVRDGPLRLTRLACSILEAINCAEELVVTADEARLTLAAGLLRSVAGQLRQAVIPSDVDPAETFYIPSGMNREDL